MDENLAQVVQSVTNDLNAIRSMIRRSGQADLASSGLTPQQGSLIEELTRQDGQTLNELCSRMGLAHSTVSGIVDRLAKKGLVERRADPKDRRYVRIHLNQMVGEYISYQLPSQRANLLVGAVQQAQPSERRIILDGLAALRRLMEKQQGLRD